MRKKSRFRNKNKDKKKNKEKENIYNIKEYDTGLTINYIRVFIVILAILFTFIYIIYTNTKKYNENVTEKKSFVQNLKDNFQSIFSEEKKNELTEIDKAFNIREDILTKIENEEYKFNSKNIYVYNLTDEIEVLSINSEDQTPTASLAKLMTGYISLLNTENIDEICPIDIPSYLEMVKRNSSMAGFYGNEQVTYKDVLSGLLLPSGGECANTLAVRLFGNVQNTVLKMNETADKLNLENTEYKTVEGLDIEGQYTSAKDVTKLFKELLKDERFRNIIKNETYTSTKTKEHPDGVVLKSTVFQKINEYFEEKPEEKEKFIYSGINILGGKTGTTWSAGNSWVTLSEKNGKEYIITTLKYDFKDIHNIGYGNVLDLFFILENI